MPARNCIGSLRCGLLYQMEAFLKERIWAIASGLRAMERAIEQVIEYDRTRYTFNGRPMIDNQYILVHSC